MQFYFLCSILILCFSHTNCRNYKYNYVAALKDSDIFYPCENQPENVLDINGLFDFSDFHSEFDENGVVIVSGNITTVWDIDPTDLIALNLVGMRYDRGSWVSTQYSISTPSFCQIMYVKNDFWYEPWIKHVINADQIKSKCLNTPGTVFVFETYPLNIILHSHESDLSGFYKVQIKMQAIGLKRTVRPNSICFEIRGDIELI